MNKKNGRADLLNKALRNMRQINRDLKREEPENRFAIYRALEIQVADIEGPSGSTSNGGIEIDVLTARRLMPFIRDFIKAELMALEARR